MTKNEFLNELNKGISGLPREDIEERLIFYGEMIDDLKEDGLSEEDAIEKIGNTDDIIAQIAAETSFTKLVKEKIRPKRSLTAPEIVLLVLGSPVWLSALISITAAVFSVYVVIWAMIISIWAIAAAFVGTALCCCLAGALFIAQHNISAGVAVIGAGFICAGISVLSFFGCRAATRGMILLTKKLIVKIKNRIIRKEIAQ